MTRVMNDARLQERWDNAIAQLTTAMAYRGPRPVDPAFALEFASLAVAARRSRSNAPRVVMLHGPVGVGVRAFGARLPLSQPTDDRDIVHVVGLPRSLAVLQDGLVREEGAITPSLESLVESVEFVERCVRELPNAIYLVNDDEERVAAVLSKLTDAAHAEIGYAVTPDGEPLYAVTKQYAHDRDIADVIGVVYVFGTDGRLLLQQRAEDETWDHSAAGHLAIGEDPVSGAARELWEELRGTGDLRAVGTGIALHPPGFPPRRHVFHCYTLTCNGPFELDPLEVLALRWTTLQQLEADLARHPHAYAGGLHATYQWLKQNNGWSTP